MLYADLFDHIRTSTTVTVLTVNQRLSQFLLQQFHTDNQQRQLTHWPTPTILPYRAWLEQLFYQPRQPDKWCHYQLLREVDELLLWENSMTHDLTCQRADAHTLAPLAYQASMLLQQWQLTESVGKCVATQEQQAFKRWHQTVHQHKQQHQLLSDYQLPDIMVDRLQYENVMCSGEIILVGFDERPPQLQTLIKALKQAKHPVSFYTPITTMQPIHTIRCHDTGSEIDTMVRWALTCIEQHPGTFIGCIVPDLVQHRQTIRDHFACLCKDDSLAINIAGGSPLANYPIIQCALLQITLMAQSLTIAQWQYLLDSPYFEHYQRDYVARAALILRLQQHPATQLTYQAIHTLAANAYSTTWDALTNYVLPTTATPDTWQQHIHQWLALFNWPGDRTLNSEEYQLVNRFYALLDEYQQIASIQPTVTVDEVIQHITQRCQKTVFQPQSPPTNIHVIGSLEAAGLPFDHAWFAHCDATQWPQQATPNPFIPLTLQRQHRLPHCDSQRELTFAQQILTGLQHSVGQLYCSYALYDGDNKQLPSPLLATTCIEDSDTLSLTTTLTFAQTIAKTTQCESITDNRGRSLPNHHLPGGTQLFKDYFACPFKAYAKHRLQATPWPATNQGGFSALQRGQLIHKALELAWRDLKTHDALLALSSTKQQQVCLKWARAAIKQLTYALLLPDTPHILHIEQQRLHHLLNEWLHLERTRPAFTIIDLESMTTLQLGEFQLTVRVDRLDQLLDGSHCIIDYKAGQMDYAMWFGERIDEPQLPLYCIQPDLTHPGIAFACIRHNALGFLSIVRDSALLPNGVTLDQVDVETTATSWQQQLAQWQTILLSAAKAMQQGQAQPDPKYAQQTCQLCHLQSLCRYAAGTIS